MLCLPITTTQCRISVRCLENRPCSSSSRAPCSHNPAEGNRRPMSTPPGASLLAARSCPSVPPYQAGHRDSDRLAASQQLLCSSKNAPRSKRRHEPRHRDCPPMRSPPTTPFRPMSFLGAMLIPAKQRRWVPNSPLYLYSNTFFRNPTDVLCVCVCVH